MGVTVADVDRTQSGSVARVPLRLRSGGRLDRRLACLQVRVGDSEQQERHEGFHSPPFLRWVGVWNQTLVV